MTTTTGHIMDDLTNRMIGVVRQVNAGRDMTADEMADAVAETMVIAIPALIEEMVAAGRTDLADRIAAHMIETARTVTGSTSRI
jgi:hypothetical protein